MKWIIATICFILYIISASYVGYYIACRDKTNAFLFSMAALLSLMGILMALILLPF